MGSAEPPFGGGGIWGQRHAPYKEYDYCKHLLGWLALRHFLGVSLGQMPADVAMAACKG